MGQVKAGIDAGGTLVKITYSENDRMHFKKYPITEMEQAISWLKLMVPSVKAAITGGKSHIIQEKFFPDAVIVPEFAATCEGARVFLKEEDRKLSEPILLVNIGTGTSWHIIDGSKNERLLGSGMGGGIFTGLGSLLTSISDYKILTVLASEGNKENVDLLVKDIYESSETPINGSLTAANFAKGKGAYNQNEADRMASLANLIAETLVLLTSQLAEQHQLKNIVLIGSASAGNPALRKSLNSYFKMVGLSPLFLNKGEYCGAMGAYLVV